MMEELLLIATIAGQRVAFRASAVQSLIELDVLTPIPRTPAHVAGLSALRSRVLTVIDCIHSLGLARDLATQQMREAIVVEQDGHWYALTVDNVDDVLVAKTEPVPLRASFGDGWDRVSLGLVDCGGEALVLMDIGALIAGPQIKAA